MKTDFNVDWKWMYITLKILKIKNDYMKRMISKMYHNSCSLSRKWEQQSAYGT